MSAPRKPGAAVTVLLIVGALIVGGVLGSGPGAVAAYFTTQPDGPTAPPSMLPEFPDAARRYLPDLTVASLASGWLVKANGYRCGPSEIKSRRSAAKNLMSCTTTEAGLSSMNVGIEYDGDAQIQYVSVRCGHKPGSNYCKTLFAGLGDALFFSRRELAKQAAEWAGENVDGDNVSTSIGGIRLSVDLGSHSITAIPDA
ncbi:hypothetical protein DMB66_37505 [Actinoplanes sp. ATCC 53533]|uniref:hypothetical protein n=1 Tax=Actinoplanes sp. ATCC 53533 TaxID=1288362 RepID=UPI000F786EF3|nr:hypothetical protein [Actinoplanes sp. ATCC 53533]RSM54642.1 hypothetical protein DMB66_37505 [Actinoplanes sp. ATCC 53533]